MITLGIETSCDETAVALIRGRKVLAEEVASSWQRHSDLGGVVPEIASRYHVEAILPCLDRVLKKGRVGLRSVDLIAVTQGPGLMGSLLVGNALAQTLSLILRRPLIGVDHVLAHAFSGQVGRTRLKFPFMSLVVSGGHTVLIHWKSIEDYRVIGRTIDDAAGEAFDKVAKMMRLGYPGGPIIDRLARKGDPAKITFPRPLLQERHFDFSFSGLKTSVLYKLRDQTTRRPLTPKMKADFAASFQEAAVDCLVVKTLRAMDHYGTKTLVVGGGVSANSRLRERLMAFHGRSNGGLKRLEVIFPPVGLALDNAVMIAALGQLLWRRKKGSRRRSGRVYSDFFVENR